VPIQTALWTVGDKPQELRIATLSSEKLLEEMIVSAPRILSEEWMLIGRQVSTTHGGIVDLVAIAPDGSLVLVELKRERTPRDVVAQALDYAAWVETLKPQEISSLYYKFTGGKDLS
jgi:RecB family endonuclease NucS